ncbi:PTS transporter subunit IIC [Hungatella hathewayi]|uniref:PTS transporter subunit IIC n=2 Tax=Lachnospiraceae TaxID=186803 RepID=UPI001D25DA12|nr:PTS transporter subunit IIC [Hungatella hathewayi]MBS6757046.1 PTS galactitol transporter subunit IIC [Hungatella hathewayi]
MELIKTFFSAITNAGSTVVLPLIFFAIGLILKMKVGKAFSAALTLGVALAGISAVTGFLSSAIGPAAASFVENTGANLNAIDMGWAPALGVAWQWEYAFLMFPLHIAINVIMLAAGMTFTLNVDMWNVANKVATGFFVYTASGNVLLGFAFVILQTVLELLIGDANQKNVQKLSGVPGVTTPHPMFLNLPLLWPIKLLLDKIIPVRKPLDINSLRSKIGIFGESHVIGFLIGLLIGLIGGYSVVESVTMAVQVATALVLIPMAAKLFMTALTPISEAANRFMKARFHDRKFCIGLDWPILAGSNEIYVTTILSIPVILALAMVLPFNIVLPLAGIMYMGIPITTLLLYQGDLLKMMITQVITIPFSLYAASYFAPMVDGLARQKGTDLSSLAEGQMMGWYGVDFGFLRWTFCEVTLGNILAIAIFVGYLVLTFFYLKARKKEEAAIEL